MQESPCKTCENKGCGAYHSSCEKYKKWMELNEERKRQKHTETLLDSLVNHHRHTAFPMWSKGRGGRRK